MSNITPTVVETLEVTSTSATSIDTAGGIDAAGAIVGLSVADAGGTLDAVRDGGITLASQASGDLMAASSVSQWARVPKGAGLSYLRMNSGATGQEWAGLPMTLVKEGSGTTTTVGAENVDTFALASSLTIKDTLVVIVRHRNTGSAANVTPILQNSTDGVTIATLSAANNNYYSDIAFISAQSTTLVCGLSLPFAGVVIAPTRATFTTSYAGAWTLALRQGGVTAPDTWQWEWAVYRLNGQ